MNKKIIIGGVAAAIILGAGSISWAATSNYTAWRSAAGTRAPRVTEQNFNQFSKMHQLMAESKYTEAQQIRTELGLGQGNGCSQGQGGCLGRGNHRSSSFVDQNNNGICDRMESIK